MAPLLCHRRMTLRPSIIFAAIASVAATFAAPASAQAPPPVSSPAPTGAPQPPAAIAPVLPTPGPSLQIVPARPSPVEPSQSPQEQGTSACVPVACAAKGQPEPWTAKDYATVAGGVSGLLAFLVGIGAILSNNRSTRANNNQKTNEAEVTSIETKLDSFYGPYTQLSSTNKLIAGELKSRHREKGEMRILLLMLDPAWRKGLSPGDQALVDEIIDIDTKLLSLIQDSAGMVDEAVQPYLYRAAAHFRMMILAHGGKLDNAPDRYSSYVYPRQLDGVVALEIARQKARMSALRLKPMKLHPPMQPLAIPDALSLNPWPA
jgi:hypothetical protein